MRFDEAKALKTFQELGDPRFAGPDCETRVADFVAQQFTKMGWQVEQRQVVGSRFAQHVATGIGWLGYGAMFTTVYVMVLTNSVLIGIVAVVLSFAIMPWARAVFFHTIHLGNHGPPAEAAPLVIASLPGQTSASVRVVFQALLGGLEPDLSHLLSRTRYGACLILTICPFAMTFMIITAKLGWILLHPGRPRTVMAYEVLTRFAYPGLLGFAWIWILWCLFDEYRRSRRLRTTPQPERYGLTLLLEMARAWPRTGSRPIEPVFVAAGGQGLDHAGSREVVRLLGSEWRSQPSLLMLFFAPGAGDKVWLSTDAPGSAGTSELALDAGRDLWIPVASASPIAWMPLWPFENCYPAIALIGSESSSADHTSADPQALHRAAQLATEIALRGPNGSNSEPRRRIRQADACVGAFTA